MMDTPVLQRTLNVAMREGLHARPASQLVQLAKTFQAKIEIERDGVVANARSAVKLMLLAVKEADEVVVRASGDDADSALDRVAAFLLSDNHGADPAPATPLAAAPAPAAVAQRSAGTPGAGVAASAGVALGPAFAYFPAVLPEPKAPPAGLDRAAEATRLSMALAGVTAALESRQAGLAADAPTYAIVQALIELAADPDWRDDMHERISRGADAYAAALGSGADLVAQFEAATDPLTHARAEDLRSLTRALGCELLGIASPTLQDVPARAIVVAEELTALDLASVDMRRIGALVCRRGASTSHAAIVARAYGVPAVFGLDVAADRLRAADRIAVDGTAGVVHLDPNAELVQGFTARVESAAVALQALQRYRDMVPRTRDGREVIVAANMGSLREIEIARHAGAMGVGLFRTELLFMQHRELPTEDEQAAIYSELASAFHPHPVIIRTLDVGGDKPVAGLEIPREENPFLGWRGVRLCLDRPDVFRPQLRALLRAAHVGNVKVMVPMVSELSEVLRVRALIDTCRDELQAEGAAFGSFELGIMIETPAAVMQAAELAAHVDFFSIGTNDLTQYVMAADRANAKVASLYRADHPAVLRAVEWTCRAAAQAGIWVGICGEAAADPALIPHWLSLGVSELSMSPAGILAAKKRICEI